MVSLISEVFFFNSATSFSYRLAILCFSCMYLSGTTRLMSILSSSLNTTSSFKPCLNLSFYFLSLDLLLTCSTLAVSSFKHVIFIFFIRGSACSISEHECMLFRACEGVVVDLIRFLNLVWLNFFTWFGFFLNHVAWVLVFCLVLRDWTWVITTQIFNLTVLDCFVNSWWQLLNILVWHEDNRYRFWIQSFNFLR